MSEVCRCSAIFSNSATDVAPSCARLLHLIRNENGACDDFLPILQPRVTEEHRIDIDAMTLIQIVHDLLGRTVETRRGQYDAVIVKIEFRQLSVEPIFKSNVQWLAQICTCVLKNLRFMAASSQDA